MSILIDVPPAVEEAVEVTFFGERILIHDGPGSVRLKPVSDDPGSNRLDENRFQPKPVWS